ncbi:protease modulator HflC [Aureimonas leprariae]|uniref:Protein HflC n=1 Tax=Plantimonas leprariae TaxID=2615207 RepID=A0A7V7PS88_9HYPH|nr:protease modulator HflC [Aureimonas leprariae]KAB0681927.1 protease modulator HflC [Aureimonas leprariae]
MTNRFYGVLVLAVVALFFVWNSLFVVRQGEQAVVLRFGQIQRVLEEPGLYAKLPFSFASADNVQKLPTRLLRSDLTDIRVQVNSGAFYEVDAFMVYRISDARKFRQAVSGGQLDVAEQRLLTRFNSAIRATYGRRSFDAALSAARAEMMVEVRDQVRPEASGLGITLEDVRISRTDLTPEVSERTYARMSAERLAEAERLRADGQVKAREIRAAADREGVTLTAQAQRDAAVLEGQGQADRNRILAEAYGRDPDFADFFRRMEAYKTALGSGTTMMLSPNDEFFRYFNSDGRGGPPPAAPAPAGTPPAPPAAPAPQ